MKYLFELAKDHKFFPKVEIESSLKAENIKYEIVKSNENVLIIETSTDKKNIEWLAYRLSHSYFINKFLFSFKPDIDKNELPILKNDAIKPGSIAVKYRNRSANINSNKIIKKLADYFTSDRIVDLTNPDHEIRAVITDSKIYVGQKLFKIDRSNFEKRKVQFRPFFSPISLHPKLARVLVNLSRINRGETLLDPFCGTGGILLEAGLIGCKIIGNDIDEKNIAGCKKTLDYYHLDNYQLFTEDIGNIREFIKNVDAVVTDFPYGKSTTTKGELLDELYNRAFKNISKILIQNRRAVIGLPNEKSIEIGSKYLKLVAFYKIKVHRSLTRYFAVFKK